MLTFQPNKLTMALVAAGLVSMASTATAQEQASAEQQAEENIEVIEVSGFRRSLVKSMNTKRFSSSVVEAISAEDIGKLPDSSIAESIARLPGLTAQRLDGRASKISIRGFGENESATTFNGREQVSIDDNRGVQFDLYPAEIMSGVTVYKTPDATIEGEGIAGVVDLQTVRPLSQDDRVIQINGTFEQTSFEELNPDADNDGFRGTFSYMDQFADDTIGIAVAVSTMESPNQEKRWNSWGYPEFSDDAGNSYSILGGAKPFVRSSMLNRDTVMGVLEFAPSDDIHITFDALHVDFTDEKILRGIEVPFAWGQGTIDPESVVVDPETGFISQATTMGQRVVVRNDYEEREAQLDSFGVNFEYNINDRWSLEADASYAKVERQIWSMESYAGTGRGDSRGVADNIGYFLDGSNEGAKFTHELDYSDYNLIQLGGPLSWGWSSALNDKYGITGTEYENQAQDGFLNTPSVDDELTALKLAATQVVESDFVTAVTYGVSYKNREKTKDSNGFFLTVSSFSLDNPGMMMVPEEYRLGSANLDFIGMGDMIAYDSRGLVEDGYYDLLSERLTDPSHETKSYTVQEEIVSLFVKADLDMEIAGFQVTGNAGLRYVDTTQSSQGAAITTEDGLVKTTPTDIEHTYSHLLPSLNLSMRIDDNQTVRFGAAKTISRARMDEMNASISTNYFGGGEAPKPDENGNFWSVSGGNPALEPKEAVGLDLTYENYFSDEGYFSVALFHKSLDNWIFDGNYEVDMTGVADPAGTPVNPDHTTATGSGKINGGDGTLYGYELSVTLPFNAFSDALDGFGVIASYTGVEQDIEDPNGNEYVLPGLSESISSVTGYYENHGLQVRVSVRNRDDFKGDVYGVGFSTQQVDIEGETIVDAQIGYDFGEAGFENLEGLSIFLQGYNLTEEPFKSTYNENALQVRDFQDYGANYMLGFSYKL
ncbi:TonB-dependent receptor [Thalassotalea ponticola]|uniref:TonB-dependent receptor n=1 Tax=Thalassotalea ponticola TaxID=1523392 RepID=UPI0025B4E810|nr:TonB-dependent receptor [Thalassotalea ponticola]MDN3652494.1 TonB-dependent receptor [Thalassotalea ponticola]